MFTLSLNILFFVKKIGKLANNTSTIQYIIRFPNKKKARTNASLILY